MKTTRIILSVLLTILLIVVGIATEVLAIIDLTVINPNFYKNTLRHLGFYESIRTVLVNQHKAFIDEQEGIDKEFKDEALVIFNRGLDKNDFAISVGNFLGDSVGYILYNEGNAELPFNQWVESINKEIMESKLIENHPDMEEALKVTLTNDLIMYGSLFKDNTNIIDIIGMFTPTPKIRDNMSRFLWVIQYWIQWLHKALYIGTAALILILALLFILWRKNRGVVYKTFGVLVVINSTIFILSGAGMFVSISFANALGKLPQSFASHSEFLQNAINPIGTLNLIVGIIMLAVGIGILILGGALTRKVNELNSTETTQIKDSVVKENNDVEVEVIEAPISKEEQEDNPADNKE